MKRFFFIFLFFSLINCNKRKFKIGLCVTATNKYIKFLKPLLRTAKFLFLNNHDVHFFVFCDQKFEFDDKTTVIKVSHKRWPFSTLMRFEYYINNKELLKNMDYLYACDADMLFMNKVDDQIISDRVAVLHPYFFDDNIKGKKEYENNKISTANVKYNEGIHYFAGGFYGGKKDEFFKILETNSKNIKLDLNKNFIAKWHDESHLNRYFIDNPPTKILDPSYCFPQYFFNHPPKNFNFRKILVALEKDHYEVRQ